MGVFKMKKQDCGFKMSSLQSEINAGPKFTMKFSNTAQNSPRKCENKHVNYEEASEVPKADGFSPMKGPTQGTSGVKEDLIPSEMDDKYMQEQESLSHLLGQKPVEEPKCEEQVDDQQNYNKIAYAKLDMKYQNLKATNQQQIKDIA